MWAEVTGALMDYFCCLMRFRGDFTSVQLTLNGYLLISKRLKFRVFSFCKKAHPNSKQVLKESTASALLFSKRDAK